MSVWDFRDENDNASLWCAKVNKSMENNETTHGGSPSRQGSVSPPNSWEHSSEDDQPLDFSRKQPTPSPSQTFSSPSSPHVPKSSEQNHYPIGHFAPPVFTNGMLSMFSSPPGFHPTGAPSPPLSAFSPLQRSTSPTSVTTSTMGDSQVKCPRPFKAYQPDGLPIRFYPLGGPQLPLGQESITALGNQELVQNLTPDSNYLQFRQQMLIQKFAQNHKRSRKSSESSQQLVPIRNGSSDTLLPVTSPDNSNSSTETPNSTVVSNGKLSETGTGNSNRKRGRQFPDDLKDEAYWERRRKNNEAAKRSRDARRAKEDEIAIRAAFLEQENLKLRVEVAALKSELAKMRCILYPA